MHSLFNMVGVEFNEIKTIPYIKNPYREKNKNPCGLRKSKKSIFISLIDIIISFVLSNEMIFSSARSPKVDLVFHQEQLTSQFGSERLEQNWSSRTW